MLDWLLHVHGEKRQEMPSQTLIGWPNPNSMNPSTLIFFRQRSIPISEAPINGIRRGVSHSLRLRCDCGS